MDDVLLVLLLPWSKGLRQADGYAADFKWYVDTSVCRGERGGDPLINMPWDTD
jgi:hypothetical protein